MADRRDLAARCETAPGHLSNVGYGYKPCGVALAVALERETKGAVTRRECRPDDWSVWWPDLAKTQLKRKGVAA